MQIKSGQLAVITGGGSGIGRALALELAREGVHLALCDLSESALSQSRAQCLAAAPAGARVSIFKADVSDEQQLLAFRDAVMREHDTDHIELLFNNAGIGGGGSFVQGERAEWERTFSVCWQGVYLGARVFMPMLIASQQGCIINVSSANGFWASLGPGIAHTAYCAAKFAVRGFTEALITDLKMHAPHVSCAVVMPGYIGTSIALNSSHVHGHGDLRELPAERVAAVRKRLQLAGGRGEGLSDDQIRKMLHQRGIDFRDGAPTSAQQAAQIILDGVRAGRWRILVGEDAVALDAKVRANPERAYDDDFNGLLIQPLRRSVAPGNPGDKESSR
ncbi:MAG: SDR family oxidoreductase [Quisquiliibacterium sp.]